MRLLLTVESNKSHVHKTSSKPVITLQLIPAVQPYIEQNYFPPAATSAISLVADCVCSVQDTLKGSKATVKTPKFCVVNDQTVKKIDGQDLDRCCSCDYRAYRSDPPL